MLFVIGVVGGVGLVVVDLGCYLGVWVIVGVGLCDKVVVVCDYGVEYVIVYIEEDLCECIWLLNGDCGVDVCFDYVGGDVFVVMVCLMVWGGCLVFLGFVCG